MDARDDEENGTMEVFCGSTNVIIMDHLGPYISLNAHPGPNCFLYTNFGR